MSGVNTIKFVAFVVCVGIAVFAHSNRADRLVRVEASTVTETGSGGPDAAKAKAAFKEAAKVFFSARCANCHPGGDGPTQGDTMTPHAMDVKRGTDGRGLEELKCTTCHQDANLDGDGLPPGVPDWHMPGPEHKMTFQGVTAAQLCRNLKDPLQNGGRKAPKDAVLHLATDPKVLWAWNPGNGRKPPPLSQPDFIKKMSEWVENGAACPD